ncbi:MAG: hypothetical protein JOY93_01115, partial [Acidobacteriales bacterium]|nr:hypothetical protein [Terriglobales bacterium]
MNLEYLFTAVCSFAPLLAGAEPGPFQSSKSSYQGSIRLHGPIENVFPLFTPEGEKSWAEGWNPDYVNPPNGDTQTGLVFRTAHSGPLLWIVSDFDVQQHQISYVIVGRDTVRLLKIKCDVQGDETVAALTHTHISLSEAGNRLVEQRAPEYLGAEITQWQDEINYFLETGMQFRTK